MKISLVVAVSANGVIGKDNDLPWRLPDDMKFFMEKTKGHYVILGRKNYESLPDKYRPLPNRTNIIVTRRRDYTAPGCTIVYSIDEAFRLAEANGEKEVMVIGGADIYRLALPFAHNLYITEIKASVEGDVYFPEYDKKDWLEVSRVSHDKDERHAYPFDYVLYQRISDL